MKITNKNKLLKECCNFFEKGNGQDAGIFLSKLCFAYLTLYKVTKEEFLKSLSNSIDIINKEIQDGNNNNN
ncbi:hypothetical protein [uncultured Rikenella sp.]|uniref:hypothetical protein n=1 Tax=uncultured Rikenella sp. TaxID=368003 RepID=UPI00261796F3|nr:hypothetical protein [uncultured Rikenella sp.]